MPAAVNGMKECTKCGETKDVSEYGKKKSNKDGLKYACRCCLAIDKKRWRESNREKISADKKRWKKNNIEKVLAEKKRYREKYREVIAEQSKKRMRIRSKNALAAVYEIVNRITGKSYVGQSTSWKSRWDSHKNALSRGVHGNPSLQADYNKYGLAAFEHRVVQEYPCDTSSDVLLEHEQRVFEEYISEGKEVYNENNPSRLYAKQSRD